jgi:hypothetical protein
MHKCLVVEHIHESLDNTKRVITDMSRKSGKTSTTVCKILYKSLWLYSCKVGMPKKLLLAPDIFD